MDALGFVVALLFLIVLCVFLYLWWKADAQRNSSLQAVGSAQTKVLPDIARVTFTVQAEHDTSAQDAMSAASSQMSAVISGLASLKDALRTQEIRVERITDDKNGSSFYRASQSLEVTTTPDALGNVIDTGLAHGAMNVDDVQIFISPELNATISKQLMKEAIDAGQKVAEQQASWAHVRLGSLSSLSTSSYAPIITLHMAAATTPVQTSVQPVEVTANLVYKIY